MSLDERLEELKEQGLVASWRLGEEPRAPLKARKGHKPRRKLLLRLTPRMFPADETDFDPDLGEVLGQALKEIAAEFGVQPEVVPPHRGRPEREKKVDPLRGKVFVASDLV